MCLLNYFNCFQYSNYNVSLYTEIKINSIINLDENKRQESITLITKNNRRHAINRERYARILNGTIRTFATICNTENSHYLI